MRYYDKRGNPITLEQWSVLLNDPDYQRVAIDQGSGRQVSTVWLGLDHRHGRGGSPLIFETMVFPMSPNGDVGVGEIDADRYSTLEEALAGHAEMAKDHAYVLDKIVRKLEESDKSVKVWTIQTEAAYEELKAEGTLYGDWSRVDKDFKKAYYWLCHQMENRGMRLRGRPPIWAWQTKPDLRHNAHLEKGEKGVRLELEVPSVELLASNYSAWHCVLNDHYLTSTDAETDKAFSDDGYTRDEIELSWQKVFDLDYCVSADYGSAVQLTMPALELHYVKKAQAFRGR